MTEDSGIRRPVRPRTIVVAMVLIVVVAAAMVVASLLLEPAPPGRVRLEELPEDATSTVGLAGIFPAEDEPALANPLGVAWDGDRLFVAESDAGVVRIFDAQGGRLGRIVLPSAGDTAAAYPSVLAIAGERLAIVDNAANRVIVVKAEPASPAGVLFSLGTDEDAPGQPTAVTYGDDGFYVADAADGTIKVYDDDGAYLRSLGADLTPALGFVGGMEIVGDRLFVADSNAGRVVVLDAGTGRQSAVFADRYALPRVIEAASGSHLAVIDAFDRAAYITTADGTRVDTIDAQSVPEGRLSSPRGAVWLEDDARLYVTDGVLGRILVFNIRLEEGID